MPSNSLSLKTTLLLVSSLTVMAGATIAPSLPQMAAVFSEVPNAEFLSKLILTIPALFIGLFGPLAGQIIDRYGRLRLLYVVVVLYAVAGVSGYFLNDLYSILIGRALLGVAVGGIMTIATTLVGDYFAENERQKFLGIQGGFMAMGGVVFITIGGLLADISWRVPFLIYLISLLMIPLAARFLYEPPRSTSKERRESKSIKTGSKIYLLYALALVSMAMFYMLPVQVPFIIKSLGITKSSLSGLAIAIAILGASLVSFSYNRIRSKLSFVQIYIMIFGIMAIGFIVIGTATTYAWLIVGMVISGLGVGSLMPNTTMWIISLTKMENRGRIMGGLTMALFFGQFLSPIIVLPIAKLGSLSLAFYLGAAAMGLMSLGFGIYWLFFREK